MTCFSRYNGVNKHFLGVGVFDFSYLLKAKFSSKLSLLGKTHGTLWLHRQQQDPFVKASARLNYRARSAFKLLEIENKHNIFKPGQIVLDCGAAPGSWSQVVVQKLRGNQRKPATVRQLMTESLKPVGFNESDIKSLFDSPKDGIVIGFDLVGIAPLPGAIFLSNTDLYEPETISKISVILKQYATLINEEALTDRCVDVVMSDMAPCCIGIPEHDHENICNLAKRAFNLVNFFLKPDGTFLFKLWDGQYTKSIVNSLKSQFGIVKILKPDASRSESAEIFVLAKKFNPKD